MELCGELMHKCAAAWAGVPLDGHSADQPQGVMLKEQPLTTHAGHRSECLGGPNHVTSVNVQARSDMVCEIYVVPLQSLKQDESIQWSDA